MQDCCENVWLDDVIGDWDNLIGMPLLVAEERHIGDDYGPNYTSSTFYTFRSIKGTVDVIWRGESNGYYSERVDHNFKV